MSRALWTACLFLCGVAAAGPVRPPPGGDFYAAGMQCFQQLDFECAIELLSAAALMTPAEDRARLVDIYRKLAESHVAIGRWEEAIHDFMEVLTLEPSYCIEPGGVSPKIQDALAKAKERLRRAASSPSAQPEAATRLGPGPREVGLAGGVELLVGQDRRLLRTGGVIELIGSMVLGKPWRLAGGIRFAFHGLSANGSTLFLAGGWMGLGVGWHIGWLSLMASGGLGATSFQVLEQGGGKYGLWIPLRLCLSYELWDDFLAGALLAPAWVVTFDDGVKTSFTLTLGGQIALAF